MVKEVNWNTVLLIGVVFVLLLSISAILASGVIDTDASGGTTDYIAKWLNTTTLSVSSIFDNGNVGIGTSDPSKKLTISGNENTTSLGYGGDLTGIDLINTATTSLPSRQVDIGFRGSHPSSEGRYAAITGVVTGSSASGQIGSLIFSTKASVSDTSLTERMRITNAGKVGIGTTNPGQELDINGSIRIQNLASKVGFGVCIKSNGVLGTCSTALNATGACACS